MQSPIDGLWVGGESFIIIITYERQAPDFLLCWELMRVLFSGKGQKVAMTLIQDMGGAKRGEEVWFNH